MNNLDKKHIEIFREYFLSHNEDVRRNIKNILSVTLLKYLSIIETGFSQNITVENIASQIEATHLIRDLSQLQTEYYSSLEQTFEKEVAFAVKVTERAAFKKQFESIESEKEFQINESDIRSTISQVERESIKQNFEEINEWEELGKAAIVASKAPPPKRGIFFNRIARYAAAAVVVGIVIFGGYLINNNSKEQKNGGLAKNENKKDSIKTEIAANLPTISEQISEQQLLVPESFGFAKEEPKIFAIVSLNIEEQMDTLKKIYSDEIKGKNVAGYGPIAKTISKQMDSLLSIRNTYTYDVTNKKIVVRLGNEQKVEKVISTDPSLKINLFIKISQGYYQLKPTVLPLKLVQVKNKDTIDEIEKLSFKTHKRLMRLKFSIILLLLSFNLFAQVNKRKLIVAQEIFDNLVNAYASNKSAPSLKILPKNSPKVVAQYLASPFPTVQVDEAVFDICMSLGQDSANALAIILSHELAHYYNDHNWCSDYAFALRNSALGSTLNKASKESKIEKESIADSYGLFYSSLAGYKPFDVFNLLLDKIYKQYKLLEVVPGYPSKMERKEINRVQKEKIQNLIPVFEAGIILQYLKYYEEAASCFEYLTKFFPSREMYNNFGVCKMSLALNYKSAETISFIYPLEIDASSRIYSQTDRGDDTLNKERKFRELTQDAKMAFDKAISLDPKYIKSHINIACLYDIRGNYQAALGVVNEAENLTSEINTDLLLIKAIALYHIKNVSEAEKILQGINSRHGKSIYNYNCKLLANSILLRNEVQAIEKWKDTWVNQQVVVSSDTCNSRYKVLNNVANNKAAIHFQGIGGSLYLGQSVFAGNPVLIMKIKNKRIIADLNIYKNAGNDVLSDSQKLVTNNGKCFSIYLPGNTWSVVYKEFLNE